MDIIVLLHSKIFLVPFLDVYKRQGCYYAVQWRKSKSFDDALDVWGIHGVGGVLGVISLGIFASTSANPAGADGLLSGNVSFFGFEVLSVLIATAWAFVFSYFALSVIDRWTPVRVTVREEMEGLDSSLHGEEAYVK